MYRCLEELYCRSLYWRVLLGDGCFEFNINVFICNGERWVEVLIYDGSSEGGFLLGLVLVLMVFIGIGNYVMLVDLFLCYN